MWHLADQQICLEKIIIKAPQATDFLLADSLIELEH